jgi:hypothetical protein
VGFSFSLTLGVDRGAVERGKEFDLVVVFLVVADVATGHDKISCNTVDLGKLLLGGNIER